MFYFSNKDKEKKNIDYSSLIEQPEIRLEHENVGFDNLKTLKESDNTLENMINKEVKIENSYNEESLAGMVLNESADLLNESILNNNTKGSKILRLSRTAVARTDKTSEKMKSLIKANVEASLIGNLKSISQVVLGVMSGVDYMKALQRAKSDKFDMELYKRLSESYRKLIPVYSKYLNSISKFDSRKSSQALKDAKIWRTSIKTDVKRILQKESKKEMSVAGIASTTGPVKGRPVNKYLSEETCIEVMWDK